MQNRRDRRAKDAPAAPTPETPSNRFGRGRPKARINISSALRSRVDPDHIAETLLTIFDDPKTPARERIQIATLIADRTEGRAVARSVSLTGEIDGALLLSMSPDQRFAFLHEVGARRLLGAPDRDPDPDPTDDDRDQDLDHQTDDDASESDQP